MAYSQQELRDIMSQFTVYGDYLVAVPFGNGNVNDTFQLTYDQGGIRLHYTLQRINQHYQPIPGICLNRWTWPLALVEFPPSGIVAQNVTS